MLKTLTIQDLVTQLVEVNRFSVEDASVIIVSLFGPEAKEVTVHQTEPLANEPGPITDVVGNVKRGESFDPNLQKFTVRDMGKALAKQFFMADVSMTKALCEFLGCYPYDRVTFAPDVSVQVQTAPNNPMAKQVGGQHYKGDKIQHFTLCMEDNIPWGEASAIKYLMRHRKKNQLQDLMKALHYVEMTIEHYHPGALATRGTAQAS